MFQDDILEALRGCFTQQSKIQFECIYREELNVPGVKAEEKKIITSQFVLWCAVYRKVKRGGLLQPVKLLKHRSQTIYNATKSGVNSTPQTPAVLSSSTQQLK